MSCNSTWFYLMAFLILGLRSLNVNGFLVKNFMVSDTLSDGEKELRIHHRGITAKETSVGYQNGLKLRQLTDGRHFIQLIYDGDEVLRDCEYIRQKTAVNNFLTTFQREVEVLQLRNVTIIPLDKQSVLWSNGTTSLPNWLNYPKLRRECHRIQMEIENAIVQRDNSTLRRSARSVLDPIRNVFIYPGTRWCGLDTMAYKYGELGELHTTDKCCRRHDYCKMNIPAMTKRWNLWNPRPFTLSHCGCDNRRKRELSDLLRVPGTKWCGKGRSAKRYTQLGGFDGPDRCCRTHDTACPFWIGAFEKKYGLFNWRINTLMHCACDERFRACLKLTDTSEANMVGKLFFNIVQTKCFVLKSKRVCKKRSWWGNKCLKIAYKKVAILRDNIPY